MDEGVSAETLEFYYPDELYNMATELCMSRGEVLEDILAAELASV